MLTNVTMDSQLGGFARRNVLVGAPKKMVEFNIQGGGSLKEAYVVGPHTKYLTNGTLAKLWGD